VLQTFDVSEMVAEDYATMMVSLAEDHGGGSENVAQLDWDYRIKKDGANRKWRWRSEEGRTSSLGIGWMGSLGNFMRRWWREKNSTIL
jgi:hypothetical protein